jgi:hypothetical protein
VHIIHVPEFSVVVCRERACAVLPSSIEAHFKPVRPPEFRWAERQGIMDAATQIERIVSDRNALRDGGEMDRE